MREQQKQKGGISGSRTSSYTKFMLSNLYRITSCALLMEPSQTNEKIITRMTSTKSRHCKLESRWKGSCAARSHFCSAAADCASVENPNCESLPPKSGECALSLQSQSGPLPWPGYRLGMWGPRWYWRLAAMSLAKCAKWCPSPGRKPLQN